MTDQKANVPSYIERLRKPAGVPPFIQREVADILQWHVDALEKLQAENERLKDEIRNLAGARLLPMRKTDLNCVVAASDAEIALANDLGAKWVKIEDGPTGAWVNPHTGEKVIPR